MLTNLAGRGQSLQDRRKRLSGFPYRSKLILPCVVCVMLIGSRTRDATATDPRAGDGGLNDLAIFLPGNQPQGLPPVEFRELKADMVRLGVDIPPAVHVHRYYYNGNKEYQGPFVVGGPTVIVVNHPRTNCRVYVEAMLPSGYPSIAYDRESITYIYPERRVRLDFAKHHEDKFRVTYLAGRGTGRRLHERGREIEERRALASQQQSLRKTLTTTHQDLTDTMRGVSIAAGKAVNSGVETVTKVASAIPGVRTFQSSGREARAGAGTKAAANKVGGELPSAPTVR